MKARQNSLGQHPIGRHALIAPIVVTGGDDDLQIALGRKRDAFKMRSAVFVPHLIVALEIVLEDHPSPAAR